MGKTILIEDGFSTIHKTGIGQYTLMYNFLLNDLGYSVINIDKNYLIKFKNKSIRRILYNIWLNSLFLLKVWKRRKEIDTIIFTNYAIPIFKIKGIKYTSVIHDLCAYKLEYSSKLIYLYETSNIKNVIKNADKIVTVSNTIKQEIVEKFGYNADKIYVVNSSTTTGLEESPDINVDSVFNKYNLQSKKYILSVATNNKRKNIQMLIEAYNNLDRNFEDIKLVLVGGSYDQSFENKSIITTGYISDTELKVLYKNALLYVFPSVYEGFGTPLIDAQKFGIPIVCSDIPVFREVADDSAIFCPIKAGAFYRAIKSLLDDKELYTQMVEKGRKNIERYSLDNIKKQIKEVLA